MSDNSQTHRNMQSPNTAEVSLSSVTEPLLVVSRLIGMNPKSGWHKLYTIFILLCEYSLVGWIGQYSGWRSFENYYFNLFVHSLQTMCCMISFSIILGSGLFDKKRFIVPVQDFVSIDESLKGLGGFIDNRNTYRLEILLFTCIGLIPTFFFFMDLSSHSSMQATDDQLYIMLFMSWFMTWTIMMICAVTDCLFSATVSIIRERFKVINSIIGRWAGKHGSYMKVNFIEVQRVQTENDIMRDLKILRKLYHELWRIGNRVNEAYGLHLLVEATTSLVLITSKLWEIYSLFVNSNSARDSIFLFGISAGITGTLFNVMRIFVLAKASESTVTEAKATYVVLQELGMKKNHDSAMKAEIRDFFMQLQFEARNFTACGFFDIDYTLVCGILGAACTYLVILIQMGDSNTCVISAGFANESIHSNHDNHS